MRTPVSLVCVAILLGVSASFTPRSAGAFAFFDVPAAAPFDVSLLDPDLHLTASPHRAALEAHRTAPEPDGVTALPPPPPFAPAKAALKPKQGRRVYGYLPYWTMDTWKPAWDGLSQLAYFSVECKADGTLGNVHGWGGPTAKALVAEAHAHGVQVTITATLMSQSGIHTIVSSPALRQKLIGNLVTAVATGGGDGINVDFEGLAKADRDDMVAFTKELGASLKVAVPGADLTLATPAVDWSGAWDYKALAAASDGLMIMAYGYHWAGGAPGPVCPLQSSGAWGSKSLTWTVSDYLTKAGTAAKGKIIAGLPLYGFDWPTTSAAVPGTATDKGKAVFGAACWAGASKASGGWKYDTAGATPYYVYTSGSAWHQVWCDTIASFELRVDFAEAQKIGGIGIWALDYDGNDKGLWSYLSEFQGGAAAGPADAGSPDTGSKDAGSTGELPATGDVAIAPEEGSGDAGPGDTGAGDVDEAPQAPAPEIVPHDGGGPLDVAGAEGPEPSADVEVGVGNESPDVVLPWADADAGGPDGGPVPSDGAGSPRAEADAVAAAGSGGGGTASSGCASGPGAPHDRGAWIVLGCAGLLAIARSRRMWRNCSM